MTKQVQKILADLRHHLEKIYGNDLGKIILYGSWARGEQTNDSDIDVAIVINKEIHPGKEIDRMIDIITDLNLKYGILLSIYPVSLSKYKSLESPLLMNVRKEGLAA